MPKQSNCPAHMVKARVKSYSARRGSGAAITSSDHRRVRITWQAMRGAQLAALEPGSVIFIELDHEDRTRVEALRLADT